MTNNNEEYVSPHWAGFRSLWWIVAIILLLLILVMWLLGYGCGGNNCQVPVETVERIVEIEKIVEVDKIVERPVEVAAALAPVTKTMQSAICTFNPDSARINTDVIATCAGVVPGGQVLIGGMSCGEEMNRIVICKTNNAGTVENNPTVITMDSSGRVAKTTAIFSLIPEPEPVNLPAARVYFDVSSDQLPANANYQSLESVISFLRNNGDSIAYVSGFHDPSGNYESNQDLSKRRAEAVSKLLQQAGISTERIVLEKPVETTGTGAPEEARRVEVTIQTNN